VDHEPDRPRERHTAVLDGLHRIQRGGQGSGNGNGQSHARGQRQGNGQGNGQGGQRRASNTQAAQPAKVAQPAPKQPFNGLFAKAAALLGGRKA
ncbi:hypothetical protein ACQCS2_05720, partial [Ralstonia pseudosolanacearum]